MCAVLSRIVKTYIIKCGFGKALWEGPLGRLFEKALWEGPLGTR